MARKGQARVMTLEQLEMIWEDMRQPHRIITQLCYYTASRVNEIVSLKGEDIQGDRIVIRLSKLKQDKTKTVSIAQSLRPFLDVADLPSSGYCFPAASWVRATVKQYRIDRSKKPDRIDERTGEAVKNHFDVVGEYGPRKHITTHAVNRAISIAADLNGLEGISSHSFRRSMATHLYDDGVPLRTIMAITGHQTLASLTHYLALDERAAHDVMVLR